MTRARRLLAIAEGYRLRASKERAIGARKSNRFGVRYAANVKADGFDEIADDFEFRSRAARLVSESKR